jgi:small subunit ribosomal protein S4
VSQTGAIKEARQKSHTRGLPQWLEFNGRDLVGKIISPPTRDQIDTAIQEQLIVEFYSR